MEELPSLNEHMIAAAREYLALGYRPIPLTPLSKAAAVKWKKFQRETPTEQDIDKWFSVGEPNIALLTGGGLLVVDLDEAGLLEEVKARFGDTPMTCQTPRGGTHLYYRLPPGEHLGNAVRIGDQPIDVRCEGGYAIVPWSRNAQGMAYRWAGSVVPVSELPIIDVSRLPKREEPKALSPVPVSENIAEMIQRARGYLAHVEGAISGQRGHDRTMRAAGILIQKFALSIEEALPLLREWNEHCEPPWSERELLHKLQDAYRLRFRSLRRDEP
jgi:hypothetical protein